MRVSASLAFAAVGAVMLNGSIFAQPAAAAGLAPLAAPMGVTYSTVEPQLPPGIDPAQAGTGSRRAPDRAE